MDDERAYYERRAREQRAAAEQAECEQTRRLHLQLAELLSGRVPPHRPR